MGAYRGGGLTTRAEPLGGFARGLSSIDDIPEGADRDALDVLGGFASRLGREDRDDVAPGRSTAERDLDGSPRHQQEAGEAENAPEQPEKHGATVAKLADSNEFSARVALGTSVR